MKEYREKLYEALEKLESEPVCMRTVEQATAVCELLCLLKTLGNGDGELKHFDRATAEKWTSRMRNEDGTAGAKWTIDQTNAAGRSVGVPLAEVGEAAFFAAMNMMYSDYCAVARTFGVDRPDFYAQMAKAFLMDRDAGAPEEKIERYWRYVAGGE